MYSRVTYQPVRWQCSDKRCNCQTINYPVHRWGGYIRVITHKLLHWAYLTVHASYWPTITDITFSCLYYPEVMIMTWQFSMLVSFPRLYFISLRSTYHEFISSMLYIVIFISDFLNSLISMVDSVLVILNWNDPSNYRWFWTLLASYCLTWLIILILSNNSKNGQS